MDKLAAAIKLERLARSIVDKILAEESAIVELTEARQYLMQCQEVAEIGQEEEESVPEYDLENHVDQAELSETHEWVVFRPDQLQPNYTPSGHRKIESFVESFESDQEAHEFAKSQKNKPLYIGYIEQRSGLLTSIRYKLED